MDKEFLLMSHSVVLLTLPLPSIQTLKILQGLLLARQASSPRTLPKANSKAQGACVSSITTKLGGGRVEYLQQWDEGGDVIGKYRREAGGPVGEQETLTSETVTPPTIAEIRWSVCGYSERSL